MASAAARFELQQQEAAPAVLVESFTLGWFNLVVRALWTPVLEKHLAGLTMELLQRGLNEHLEKHAARTPWRFIETIAVEEFSFGLVPPQLQFACARYDPAQQRLSFAMDAEFQSSGAQGTLLVRSKSIGMLQGLSGRLEATHIRLSGRLHIALQLTHEPPGIKGIYYSFARQPELEVGVHPLGASRLLSELPVIVTALRALLARVLRRRMVEPQRRFYDFQRHYTLRSVKRAGGPGGLLRVVVLRASNIVLSPGQPPRAAAYGASSTPPPAADADGGGGGPHRSHATFVQLRFGRQLLRTPVLHHSGDAVDTRWSWSLALPAAVGDLPPRHDALALRVCDAKTLGEPVVLGSCEVKLPGLGLEPNTPPLELVLPLGRRAPAGAVLQLSVQWLTAPPPKGDPFEAVDARLAQAAASANPKAAAGTPAAAAAQQAGAVRSAKQHGSPPPALSPAVVAATAASLRGGEAAAPPSPLLQPALPAAVHAAAEGPSSAARAPDLARTSAPPQHDGAPRPPLPDSFHRRVGSAGQLPPRREDRAVAAAAPAAPPPRSESPSTPSAQAGEYVGAARSEGSSSVGRLSLLGSWAHVGGSQVSGSPGDGRLVVSGPGDASPAPSGAAGGKEASAHGGALPTRRTPGPPAAVGGPTDPGTDAVSTSGMSSQDGGGSAQSAPGAAAGLADSLAGLGDDGASTGAAAPALRVATRSPPPSPLARAGPLDLLAHVSRLQQQLEDQRCSAAAARAQLAELLERHERLLDTRRSNGRRALIAGGRFLLHDAGGKARPVLLWLDKESGSLCIAAPPADATGRGLLPRLRRAGLARSRSHTHLGSGSDSTTAAAARASSAAGCGGADGLAVAVGRLCTARKSELSLLHRTPMCAVAGLRGGDALFASGADGCSGSGELEAAVDPELCFSILDGGPAGSTWDLQVPPRCGNGRSRDEWLTALRDAWQDFQQDG
ncbi:hypothetical protein Rsub_06085 [Raphidocelis subcapitata]|uniref:SMP-LTD domain-containing protein n=1 Tax=Raphidocelis subcapitata TaxID=307507 RepID=A0A2V0P7A4_9CHLO|nr:hypothetical protein Rsub_06085 [Raphidocelis subcapitata]|eukprot:GBF93753.1 hypothetical protein Rsub_06085 [Raphidocelis subcapitata]